MGLVRWRVDIHLSDADGARVSRAVLRHGNAAASYRSQGLAWPLEEGDAPSAVDDLLATARALRHLSDVLLRQALNPGEVDGIAEAPVAS